jgi:hypothetical protein
MASMSRTTLILAVALLAVPAAAQGQSGAASRPAEVDECGAPTGRRARRNTEASAATRTPPRVLGVRSDSAAAAGTGMAASGHASGAQGTTPASGAHGAASSTQESGAQGMTPASASHGAASSTQESGAQGMTPASASHGVASSTQASGAQGMTPASASHGAASSTQASGTQGMTSSTSGAQGAASSTAGSGSAVRPSEGTGSAASSTAGAGQAMTSSTSASGGQGMTAAGATGAAAGAGQTMTSATSASGGDWQEAAARINRAALRLGSTAAGVRLGPAGSVSVPTALGVDAGEVFFGVAYQGRTRYTEADDGAAVVGFGLGSRRVLALETALTTYSTFRGEPFETGGVSFKLHRALPSHTSVAVGWENAILWGDSDDDGSLYAAATRMVSLRPDSVRGLFSTGVVTLGVGNGRFRSEKDDAAGNETVNVFAAAGVRVSDPLSLVADWTGQDLNAAASITPVPRVPLVVTVGLADIIGSAGDGARFILSLGYGLAFPQPF